MEGETLHFHHLISWCHTAIVLVEVDNDED